jgi:hypothetical protein
MVNWKAAVRTWKRNTTEGKSKKIKLLPIPGKNCYKCRMPAVHRDGTGGYDTYTCAEHMPAKVKEKYE